MPRQTNDLAQLIHTVWPEPDQGDLILYTAIAEVVGFPKGTREFTRAIKGWRRDLLVRGIYLDATREHGEGLRVLTDEGRFMAYDRGIGHIGRTLETKTAMLESLPDDRLSSAKQQAKHHRLRHSSLMAGHLRNFQSQVATPALQAVRKPVG